MPVIPVHHQLPEPVQTHVHHVGDAIKPSRSLSSPSPALVHVMIKTEHALAYSIYPIFLYLLNVDKINLDESIFVVPDVQIPEREERRPPRQCSWQKGEVYY